MGLHREAGRRQPRQVAGAGVHVEHTFAGRALEVVVVRVAHRLVAQVLARQLHRLQLTVFHHRLQVAVDGGDAQARHGGLRGVQHLLRQQRAVGGGDGIADGGALAGGSFHGPAMLRPMIDNAISKSENPAPPVMLRLHDLTLGYDRHPAVHHLGLTVQTGALLAVVGPNGAGKSTLLKGIAGLLAPMSGRVEHGAPAGAPGLPAAAGGDRPQLPAQRVRHRGHGPVARNRGAGPAERGAARALPRGLARRGPAGLRAPHAGHPLRRPVPARAVCAADAARCGADPAGRTLCRGGRSHHRGADGAGAGLACPGPHRAGRVARPGAGAPRLPADPAAGARGRGLRPHRRGADAAAAAAHPRHGRGLRRRRGAVRAAATGTGT